jgi:phosphatidylglycerol:prolipoprotein diacylglycerol transferase
MAYIVGLLAGWWLIVRAMRRPALWPGDTPPLRPEQVEGLLTAVILGVIIGGRMGYALFYQPGGYLSDPLSILRIWEGACPSTAAFWRCRRRVDLLPPHRRPPLQVADAMAMVVAIGIGLGRSRTSSMPSFGGGPPTCPGASSSPVRPRRPAPAPSA